MAESKVFASVCDNQGGGFDIVFSLPRGGEKRYASVFASKAPALELAERINRLGVSEQHLDDVIEDALM